MQQNFLNLKKFSKSLKIKKIKVLYHFKLFSNNNNKISIKVLSNDNYSAAASVLVIIDYQKIITYLMAKLLQNTDYYYIMCSKFIYAIIFYFFFLFLFIFIVYIVFYLSFYLRSWFIICHLWFNILIVTIK